MGEAKERVGLFRRPWCKLGRANKHIEDLQREIELFEDTHPYECFAEADPEFGNQIVHKIKLTSVFPDSFDLILGDAINNLRESLDCAGYAVAMACGKPRPRFCAFPFGGSAAEFENNMRGNSKDLPEEIRSLFRTFQPHKGGDDLLWALSRISNANKHTVLIPCGIAVQRAKEGTIQYLRDSRFYLNFPPPRWNRAKQEIIVAISSPTPHLEFKCDFTFFVAFDEVEIVGGKEALGVLNTLAGKVEGILLAIETEARRIGLAI